MDGALQPGCDRATNGAQRIAQRLVARTGGFAEVVVGATAAIPTTAAMGILSDALTRSDLLRGVLGVAAAAGSFRAGAAVAVINQPRLPQLYGQYEHIACRYVRAGGARVKVFYPAAGPGDVPAPYCTDGRATSDGMAGLVGFRQLGLSFLLGHLAEARSGCTPAKS